MIRPAHRSEIPVILDITKACALHLSASGIEQWNESYPSMEAFEADLLRNELYVYLYQEQLVGCVVMTALMDPEYSEITWLTPNDNNLYIHRLAVHPQYQGRGIAKALMDEMELLARQNGAVSIRLDTFSQNKRNQRFYENRGYVRLGDIYLPGQSTHPFHCYELLL